MLSENDHDRSTGPRRAIGYEYGTELALAWGPRLSAAEVRDMRGELFDLIHELAEVEGWADERRDRVLYPALCGSLGDLLPDLHHFRQRVADTRAATAARNVAEIVESGLLLTKAPRHP
ncbi:hypothetical protein [Burkholderia multivorans]|uniref:hypothetical protein n=1 Tax=Burkholderia multivorans TaxID=87883 RepID=UPI000D009A9B|nr:hypothetical protein [Burkholderia multivorans]MCA7956404.1 hypothetical protein [Burkholderia multivorans]MDN7593310.1 hypothetical protein [Burkholderia multivorans]PRG20933.1 hypothetical protein C6Q35_21405 [Burkholderia multivorans]